MKRVFFLPASFWAMLVLAALLALLVPRFATVGNAENLFRVAAILSLASAGQALVLVIGGIDFTLGAAVAICSVATMLALPIGGSTGALILGGLAAIGVGAVNALLVAKLRVIPVVATLGVSLAVAGLAAHFTGGMPLDPVVDEAFLWLGRGTIASVPVPIVLAGAGLGMLHVLLAHTVAGRYWALLGINASAAAHAGLPVRGLTLAAYTLCGVYTALAGMVLTSRVASGQPQLYPTLAFEAIAACAVGGVSLFGGKASALQVLSGVLIVAMMNNAVVLLNLPSAYQQLATGLVIVGAVALQQSQWRFGVGVWQAAIFVPRMQGKR